MKEFVTYYLEDVDLWDKIDNLNGEIGDSGCELAWSDQYYTAIEDKIWEMLNDKNSQFSKSEYYDGLANEYMFEEYFEGKENEDDCNFELLSFEEQCDVMSAAVYNCDLLYMVAIADVLGLEIPKSSGDIHVFDCLNPEEENER